MIRGGHIDLAILRTMEVGAKGDLANWMIPSKMIKGMGGSMDLVVGAKRVVIIRTHTNKKGVPKLLDECKLTIGGIGVVDRIITDLALIDVTEDGLVLRELAPGVSAREVQEKTAPWRNARRALLPGLPRAPAHAPARG